MKINRRTKTIGWLLLSAVFLITVTLWGCFWREEALITDFSRKNLPPCREYLFGTDFMGRDMFVRTIAGLSLSIRLGILTAAASAVFAGILGICGAVLGKAADSFVTFLIDLVMGIPHILLLILISYACGKGFFGVVVGITLTHWTSLARLLRGEVLQLKNSQYIQIASRLGMGKLQIAAKHMVCHLLPQFFTGLILLFPHAILHEASITFLGFGLSPEDAAMGVILSESMKYLATGKWWLALFPGLSLVLTVLLFALLGERLRLLLSPASSQE